MTIDEFKKNIAPFMRKGWVAMDKDNLYWWYRRKPRKLITYWNAKRLKGNDICYLPILFNIKPVKDWTQSLIKVGKCIK